MASGKQLSEDNIQTAVVRLPTCNACPPIDLIADETYGHRQAFNAPTVGQAVTDEIHAPHLIDTLGQLQRHALRGGRLTYLRREPSHQITTGWRTRSGRSPLDARTSCSLDHCGRDSARPQ